MNTLIKSTNAQRRSGTLQRNEILIALCDKGMGLIEVGRIFGLSRKAVWRIYNRHLKQLQELEYQKEAKP